MWKSILDAHTPRRTGVDLSMDNINDFATHQNKDAPFSIKDKSPWWHRQTPATTRIKYTFGQKWKIFHRLLTLFLYVFNLSQRQHCTNSLLLHRSDVRITAHIQSLGVIGLCYGGVAVAQKHFWTRERVNIR